MLEGVPGLAKTLMISTLAQLLDLTFRRIQFTPDLMPSDITGTEILQEDSAAGRRDLRVRQRPRLHQHHPGRRNQPHAAQDAGGAAGGDAGDGSHRRRRDLPAGRAVSSSSATQNPIEQEGTYPLPEAQLDRFMFKIIVDLSEFQRRVGDRRADDLERRAVAEADVGPGGDPHPAEDRAEGDRRPERGGLCGATGAGDAPRLPRRPRLHQ